MTRQKTTTTPTVAISISESPDMAVLGLSEEHLQDAGRNRTANALLGNESGLRWGFTRSRIYPIRTANVRTGLRWGTRSRILLFELVVRDHPHHSGKITVTDYLAWPVHIRMTADDLAAFAAGHEGSAHLVFLTRDGSRLEQELRLELPIHEPDDDEWAEGLTAMRLVMGKATRARIVLGGRVSGYKGRMPGVAEETLLSLRSHQPVFLLGGFGGCTRDIAEMIGLVDRWAGSRPNWEGRLCFESYSASDLHNGLSDEDNAILAQTPHIHQAIMLVSRGLRRVLKQSNSTDARGDANA